MSSQTPLFLFSERHTGTHFVRGLLFLHPEISFPMQEDHPHPTHPNGVLRTLYRQYMDGEITQSVLCEQLEGYTSCLSHQQTMCSEMQQIGIPIFPELKEMYPIRYGLHVMHSSVFRRYDWSQEVLTIIPIRDPYAVLVSHVRRRPTALPLVIDRIHYCLQLPNTFRFPVDLWADPVFAEERMKIYDFLQLPISTMCNTYLKQYPRWGSVDDRQWEVRHNLGTGYLVEADAVWKAYQQGEMHPMMESVVKYLRGFGWQAEFEAMGYTDLLWF